MKEIISKQKKKEEAFNLQGLTREEDQKGCVFIHWKGGWPLLDPSLNAYLCVHMCDPLPFYSQFYSVVRIFFVVSGKMFGVHCWTKETLKHLLLHLSYIPTRFFGSSIKDSVAQNIVEEFRKSSHFLLLDRLFVKDHKPRCQPAT